MLLAQEKIIKNFDNTERSEILLVAINNLDIRKSKNESIGRQVTTGLIISRVLSVLNNKSIENIADKEVLNAFNSSGVVLDTSIIDKILIAAKENYKN